jgi:hypothetical protein
MTRASGSVLDARGGLVLGRRAWWGYVPQHEVDEIFGVVDRVGAMTWSRLSAR